MRVLNISPFPTLPLDNGGKIRNYYLNRCLSRHHTINQFSLNLFLKDGKIPLHSWRNCFNANYTEYNYSRLHILFISFLLHKLNISPYAISSQILAFSRIHKRLGKNWDVVQIEEPWLFDWVRQRFEHPYIASAHNVEYLLVSDKNNFQYKSIFRDKIIEKTYRIEKRYLEESDLIFSCCDYDTKKMQEIYDIDTAKIRLIPNGIDATVITPSSDSERERLKEKFGFRGKKIVLYSSGLHAPNVEAMKFIFQVAGKMKRKDTIFVIAGSIGGGYLNRGNLVFTGRLQHEDILTYFRMADVALNPVRYGSGTDIKLFEYLGEGIPTIATKFGARGLYYTHKRDIIIAEELEDYIFWIEKILDDDKINMRLRKNARKCVIGKFDYETIAKKVSKCYEEIKRGGFN